MVAYAPASTLNATLREVFIACSNRQNASRATTAFLRQFAIHRSSGVHPRHYVFCKQHRSCDRNSSHVHLQRQVYHSTAPLHLHLFAISDNRSYTAKWMNQIIAHVHLDIGAGECLARMLTNNAQLVSDVWGTVVHLFCVRALASVECGKLSLTTLIC